VSSVDTRVAHWVDIAAEMLSAPLTEFPVEVIGRGLIDSFEADYAAISWRHVDGRSGLRSVARPGAAHGGHSAPDATALAVTAVTSPLLDHHPLVRWFIATDSGAPQSMRRVPEAVLSDRSADAVDLLHLIGSDQELAIPLHLQGVSHHVMVVGRAGSADFSNEDMAVARRVQPLLLAVHRQVHVLGLALPGARPSGSAVLAADSSALDAGDGILGAGLLERLPSDLGLSGRELAVLQLLASGRTAGAIGWALGCSGRTVQKHLEHVYRKLGVSDRVNAVLIGRQAGLIRIPASPPSPEASGPRALLRP
jgi:DNA-binding CsgD family transcriptional regulator